MWCNVNRALLEREPLFSTTVTFGWIFIILAFVGQDLFLRSPTPLKTTQGQALLKSSDLFFLFLIHQQ